MVTRRRQATDLEVTAALQDLDDAPERIPAWEWPADLIGLDMPGLYSWWVDDTGAGDLTTGLGEAVSAGRIYGGQDGATRWPSGKVVTATLGSRIGANHLRGK